MHVELSCRIHAVSHLHLVAVLVHVYRRLHVLTLLPTGLLSDLLEDGTIRGSFSGNKTTYTPHVYTHAQTSWINTFFTQNGYLGKNSLPALTVPTAISCVRLQDDFILKSNVKVYIQ